MNFEQVLVPRSLNCQMDFLYVSDIVCWRAQMISDSDFLTSVLVAMNIFLTYHGVLFHLYVLRMVHLTYLDP